MQQIPAIRRGARSRYDTAVFDRHELSNGITAWVQRSPIQLSEKGVLVAYFPHVGSVLDPVGKEGTAHFFEHMPFKGTERFPERAAIARMLRDAGGGYNAATSLTGTHYHVEAIRAAFPDALAVLADIVQRPLMRPEDFATERGVIHAERARLFENGATLAVHDKDALLYGAHPAFRWGIGSSESIDAISLEDLHAFRAAHYHANNLHLVVGGSFSEDPGVLAALEGAFGSMPGGEQARIALPELPAIEPVRRSIQDRRYGRGRYLVEWTRPGVYTQESFRALGLLIGAYSGGSDAPLPLELRERRGLVYEQQLMGMYRALDAGIRITLDLPVPPGQLDDVLESARVLMRDLPDERIARVLGRWQTDRLTSFANPTRIAKGLMSDLVRFGRPRTIHEEEQEEDSIDLDLVHAWKDFLSSTPPAIVEIVADVS